jgi:hypothetical protein
MVTGPYASLGTLYSCAVVLVEAVTVEHIAQRGNLLSLQPCMDSRTDTLSWTSGLPCPQPFLQQQGHGDDAHQTGGRLGDGRVRELSYGLSR